MKKVFWLLILTGALLLAGCGDKQTGGGEYRFLQGERITQADIDYLREKGAAVNGEKIEDVSESLSLETVACMRSMILEAAEQNVGISWDEALKQAKEHYETAETVAKSGESVGTEPYEQAGYLEWLQDYMQRANMSLEEWYEYNAVTLQYVAAYQGLEEKLVAGMPPEQQDNLVAQGTAWLAYQIELIEKYQDQLVEEDLQAQLAEVLAQMQYRLQNMQK